jgi:hypothetical protein
VDGAGVVARSVQVTELRKATTRVIHGLGTGSQSKADPSFLPSFPPTPQKRLSDTFPPTHRARRRRGNGERKVGKAQNFPLPSFFRKDKEDRQRGERGRRKDQGVTVKRTFHLLFPLSLF